MINEQFEAVFNIIINLYQGLIVTYFLVQCLNHKEKYDRNMVYTIGTITIFTYLEIQVLMTDFEGIGVLLLMVLTGLFSVLFLEGRMITKILYNAILIIITVYTATLVGSIVGLFNNTGYIQLVSDSSAPKYISMLLNQIVLYIVIRLVVKFIKQNRMGFNPGYTVLVILMSVISIFTVVALQKVIALKDGKYSLLYTCEVVVGIILLLTVSLIMYGISEKNHLEKLKREMEINAYKRQEHDIEEINRNFHEVEKVHHEMNKVFATVSRLLQDNKYMEAEKFIKQFQTQEINRIKKIHYTDNIILNYLINQKIEECRQKNIHFKYIINGEFDGIEDIDMHSIISNLLDNAIEASQNLLNRNIEFSIFGSQYSIYIEVTNTTLGDVLENNPLFNTSKTDKSGHGYGIKNVRNAVEKYNGDIKYRQKLKGYLTCQVMLLKKFTT